MYLNFSRVHREETRPWTASSALSYIFRSSIFPSLSKIVSSLIRVQPIRSLHLSRSSIVSLLLTIERRRSLYNTARFDSSLVYFVDSISSETSKSMFSAWTKRAVVSRRLHRWRRHFSFFFYASSLLPRAVSKQNESSKWNKVVSWTMAEAMREWPSKAPGSSDRLETLLELQK